MSTAEARGSEIKERSKRILDHVRAGKSMPEICDLEGIDPENQIKFIGKPAKDAGLTIAVAPPGWLPKGLDKKTSSFRAALGAYLAELRDKHHYIEVCRMTGMTQAEQRRAVKSPTHNWTFSQMQRLAAAHNLTFEQLLTSCIQRSTREKGVGF